MNHAVKNDVNDIDEEKYGPCGRNPKIRVLTGIYALPKRHYYSIPLNKRRTRKWNSIERIK